MPRCEKNHTPPHRTPTASGKVSSSASMRAGGRKPLTASLRFHRSNIFALIAPQSCDLTLGLTLGTPKLTTLPTSATLLVNET